jgi:hypothetical protein
MSSYNLNQFNSFLQKATDAITCNSECQRNRTIDRLKQKFINAQTNIASANNQLQVAEKNYVTFAEGEGEYNDLRQQQLQEKANLISEKFQENFNKETNQVVRQIETYDGILINFKNVVDLYFHYKKENIKLFKKLKQETNDVLTNERKSYYINQESDTLSYFYFYFLLIIYIIIFISYFLFSFIYPSNTSILKHILIFIGFIVLPFLSYFILAGIIYIGYIIVGFIPKNVYRLE